MIFFISMWARHEHDGEHENRYTTLSFICLFMSLCSSFVSCAREVNKLIFFHLTYVYLCRALLEKSLEVQLKLSRCCWMLCQTWNKSLFVTYHWFHRGGFKVALICHLFVTYLVHLLPIWRENTNKWWISKKISGQ